ncbi:kanadaptin [Macadamia integrifolia]|uniref:kanadaptin n=1 Tax=Macadamia integrifolia TaxID=60698 RepID=UPI001C4FC29D|nr:kanadaptin [Macadamia integrifolia]
MTMDPPPPRNPNPNPSNSDAEPDDADKMRAPMALPPEREAPENSEPRPSSDSTPGEAPNIAVPYTIPLWSEAPCHPFFLEVLKDGHIIDQFDVSKKGAYMFGRVDLCDFVLEHPTISRFHAVLQFKKDGDTYLYDLGSTHGTFVNKKQVTKKVYTELHVGDVIRFGNSSRLYIFQGPLELMPPEADLTNIRNAKFKEELQDREASLLRARVEASLADGISWGMADDAIEEIEEDAEEVTWQTYKGQLTEKQEKTRNKIIKRSEKIANMRKEIDAIRAKDIAQGGLTQGQQTQIARNEQRMSQIMEELENLEETLNESIQESIGARVGKIVHGKKKEDAEDEEEAPSDEDEFYDRTKQKPAIQTSGDHQSIETAETLLDKKEAITKEMEKKREFLSNENSRTGPETEGGAEGSDPLDAYMTGLSSQLVLDTTMQLEKEISALQSELDRVVYLLKIADPTGEAARKKDLRMQGSKSNEQDVPKSGTMKQPTVKKTKSSVPEKVENDSSMNGTPSAVTDTSKPPETDNSASESMDSKAPAYTVSKPLWLGATQDREVKEIQQETPLNIDESDNFIDYKDRKKTLGAVDDALPKKESDLESAGPGLIIRKRKQVEKHEVGDNRAPEQSTSVTAEAESSAADAVALLLKHQRGVFASEDDGIDESQHSHAEAQPKKDDSKSRRDGSKSRRVLGPERPSFLGSSPDYESWVPPEGQSGDGRTSLNDRYGY